MQPITCDENHRLHFNKVEYLGKPVAPNFSEETHHNNFITQHQVSFHRHKLVYRTLNIVLLFNNRKSIFYLELGKLVIRKILLTLAPFYEGSLVPSTECIKLSVEASQT